MEALLANENEVDLRCQKITGSKYPLHPLVAITGRISTRRRYYAGPIALPIKSNRYT
jgi:hypothetical protein